MLPEQHHTPTTTTRTTETSIYTLEPLRTDGPDALTPDTANGITKITLREIEIHWRNTSDEITINRADNLFACLPADDRPNQPIPAKGKLARATFDLQLDQEPRPHKISITPPNKLTLEFPQDTHRILLWLQKCRFSVLRGLAKTTALILLSALSAISAADDGDDLSDERDTEPRPTIRA